MLRILLFVIVIFLLIRAVVRFLANRLLMQKWPFHSFGGNRSDRAPSSGIAEETEFEVIDSHINTNDERS